MAVNNSLVLILGLSNTSIPFAEVTGGEIQPSAQMSQVRNEEQMKTLAAPC